MTQALRTKMVEKQEQIVDMKKFLVSLNNPLCNKGR